MANMPLQHCLIEQAQNGAKEEQMAEGEKNPIFQGSN